MRIKETADKVWADEVRKAIKANDGYCPCRLEKTEDTRCICKEFRDQKSGECRCGLYVKAESEVIKIKYFEPDLEPIKKISVGDWIDLRAAETVCLSRGEYRLIRLGVGMILPDGYEAHVLPRSSTATQFGIMLANSMGVIDNSYSGDSDEWHFPAVAICNTIIEKGDRIAQFRIVKNQPSIEFETVENLDEVSRGGLGSTGKK